MLNAAHDQSLPEIVLVEDDSGVRRSILMLLKAHGLNAKAYGSGATLAHDPSARAARLLIADWQMPDMNGFEVLASLRSTGWAGAGLMLTGYYDAVLAAKARKEGFQEVLPKPVLDHELIGTGHTAALRATAKGRGTKIWVMSVAFFVGPVRGCWHAHFSADLWGR